MKKQHASKNEMINDRRLMIVPIHPSFFSLISATGNYIVSSKELPEDAVFITAHYNPERGAFDCLFKSKEFDIVPMGQLIKRLNLVRVTIRKDGEKTNDNIRAD